MEKPPAKPFNKGKPKKPGKPKDPTPAVSVRKERIAKRLARAGVASRREVERLIGLGRIAVNGRVLDTPAVLVSGQDVVTLDGRPVERPEATRVWRFHKTVGLITAAKDPMGRPTVFDALPEGMPRVIKIGRLDINSEGLLLLTNDGELARALELPATGWVRRYRARARGSVTQDKLDTLKNGVTIDGVRYGPIEATLDKAKEKSADGKSPANLWISVALTEGKNREVRKVLEHLGVTVNRLIRLSYGPFQLGTLEAGEVAEIGPRVIREQLSGMIHPESLPLGDDVEALPEAGAAKRRQGLSDPSMKPSKVRAHAAKQATLVAEQQARNERREARRAESDRSGDRPKRDFKPRREGEERPRREFRPRDGEGGDRPKRDFKPRGEGAGDRPKRTFKPRDGESGDRPKRDFKPRSEGSGDRPKRSFKPRDGEGGDRPKRDFKPRGEGAGDRPKRDFKPRGPGGPRPTGRSGGGRSGGPSGGKPGGRPGGPRKPRG